MTRRDTTFTSFRNAHTATTVDESKRKKATYTRRMIGRTCTQIVKRGASVAFFSFTECFIPT